MDLACRMGVHRWRTSHTARPGVAVHRCTRCPAFARTTGGRARRKKRHYMLGAALLSLFIWYVVVSLGLTGHTRLLRGAKAVVHDVRRVARPAPHGPAAPAPLSG